MANTVHINSEKLKQLREQRTLSQEGLEQACRRTQGCSISMATIKRAELGRPISRRSATRIANFFSISLDDLITAPLNQQPTPPSLTSKPTKSIVLWFQTSQCQLLRTISEKALHFDPHMFQRMGDTLVVAFPYQPHSLCSLILQSTLLKLCRSSASYRALLTLEELTQATPYQWQMSPQQSQHLFGIVERMSDGGIAVSQALYQQSYGILNYHITSPINGYQVLLQDQGMSSNSSFNELTNLQHNAFRFSELYGSDTELIL